MKQEADPPAFHQILNAQRPRAARVRARSCKPLLSKPRRMTTAIHRRGRAAPSTSTAGSHQLLPRKSTVTTTIS
jgi:hypothetical protein